MPWSSVLQTILIGTDRRQLPESTAAGLGLNASEEPVRTALEALASVALLRKAGFQPSVQQQVEPLPAPLESSGQPVLPEAAAKVLMRMLGGAFTAGLPEFLGLMEQHHFRLPPELLPELLDKCLSDQSISAALKPLLGPRGRWLALQNERWQALATELSDIDWFTATYEERRLLLAATRLRNPILSLAWLEKTWAEEKADHKVQFLTMLRVRLSDMDTDLLERAFADKNRELRLEALSLLVLLPENTISSALQSFFMNHLSGAMPPDTRETYLKTTLPDLSDEGLKPWFDLLSKREKSDWRNGLLQLFVRFLPPSQLLSTTKNKRSDLVAAVDGGNQTALAEALLDNLIRQEGASWAQAIWQYYCINFRHPLWQTSVMQRFMHLHAESLMQHLAARQIALDYNSQFVLRVLENYRAPWSKPLFQQVLQQYRTAISGNMPGWHYSSVLQTAAWHCDLPDGLLVLRASLQEPGPVQGREWVEFLNIVQFRQQMHGVLSGH